MSPRKDAGYDVTDYRLVDPMFGTNDDAEALIRTAHEHGRDYRGSGAKSHVRSACLVPSCPARSGAPNVTCTGSVTGVAMAVSRLTTGARFLATLLGRGCVTARMPRFAVGR